VNELVTTDILLWLYHFLYRFLGEFGFVYFFCNTLQNPGWFKWQVLGGQKETKVRSGNIFNTLVILKSLHNVRKKPESSPHSLLQKIENISKTA